MSNNNINNNSVNQTLFQDAMDTSRYLRIKEERERTVVCRVFFGNNERNLSFAGTVELPKRLFFFNGNTRIGFNNAELTASAESKRQPNKKRRRNEDEDDNEYGEEYGYE